MKTRLLGNLLLLGLLAAMVAGCNGSRDEDHTPPSGMGSIMLRNNTDSDIDVISTVSPPASVPTIVPPRPTI